MQSKSKEKLYNQYLKHQKGLGVLWLWLEQWSSLESWSLSNEIQNIKGENAITICLDETLSKRFLVGKPKKNKRIKSKAPFLGVQNEESLWIKKIKWLRFVWDKEKNTLWLISKFIPSPDSGWPDLPSISIGILFNAEQSINLLENTKDIKLDIRQVFWDDSNNFNVEKTSNLAVILKHGSLKDNWSYKDQGAPNTIEDILNRKLVETSIDHEPEFLGQAPVLDKSQLKLIEPFKGEKPIKPIEKDYPNLFGQFLD